MVSIQERLKALSRLKDVLSDTQTEEMDALLRRVFAQNGWFDPKWVRFQFQALSAMLDQDMQAWRARYPEVPEPKRVGVIGAGNLPLVCFHDILSVIASGHALVLKPSTEDSLLPAWLIDRLLEIEPSLAPHVEVRTDLKCPLDAVLMTGSDNAVQHFKSYFKEKSLMCRGNRTSVAVLTGNETQEELQGLALDVLAYYGRGCRNVGKVFLPQGYDLNTLFSALYAQKDVIYNKKYGNNYDYTRAIYMMEHIEFTENGFLLLRESEELFAPTSVLYFQYYRDSTELEGILGDIKDQLQLVVGRDVPMGSAQYPTLESYADGKDVMSFLTSL